MARLRLSETKDWELENSDQDLRKRDLWDAHGHRLGTIDDMIVDTESERVVTIVLDSGDQFPAEDIAIGEDAVYVLHYDASTETPRSVRRYDDERVRRRAGETSAFEWSRRDTEAAPRPADVEERDREAQEREARDREDRERREREEREAREREARDREDREQRERDEREAREREAREREARDREDRERREREEREARERGRRTYTDFTDDFRRHYDGEFGDRGRDFTDWEPAYRFGYDMAFETEYVGRDFETAEEDLRREYYRRMGYPMSDRHVWDDVRDAVRHAFERSREVERQV